MRNALPHIGRLLALAEANPALFVIVASFSVPLALIYAALSFVNAPALNLLAFLTLSALALIYCGWLARLVLRHWGGAASGQHPG